jgi:predicted phosphodiesterase
MRVLILSDIHANLIALETVLSAADKQYDLLWCLGDVVGYGPRPNECVELIRSKAALCVMGNHDWAALGRAGVNVDDFNPQARQAVLWTRAQLSPENRAYLDGLPDMPIHAPQGSTILVTHASPREPVWEYILTPMTAMENFAEFSEAICLVGHTHKPAIFRWRLHEQGDADAASASVQYLQAAEGVAVKLETSPTQRLIANPGSVGQPRDNDARAAYVIFDTELLTWRQERVAYPIELTQNQMREAGLPKRLVDRLSFGW